LLAGCGGSQPPIGAPGAMPQSRAVATHADRGKSWMLPEAKKSDLLYVTNGDYGVLVYAYPRVRLVGTLSGFEGLDGLCADKAGDIFIPSAGLAEIFEYAHGGTSPIATLSDQDGEAHACSVDPTTGNLAVTNIDSLSGSGGGNIAIYAHA
jgi:hypothetical protein